MNVTIKYLDKFKEFSNKNIIIIGNSQDRDFVVEELQDGVLIKLIYTQKYNNYVLVNSSNSKDILFNNKEFSKVLVPSDFSINVSDIPDIISCTVDCKSALTDKSSVKTVKSVENAATLTRNSVQAKDVFDNMIETHRVAIIKEIGYKIVELKSAIKSATVTSFILNVAIVVLSVICSFGITNFLLGLQIDTSSSVLNLTTNIGFLVCISGIVTAISLILKFGVFSLLEFNKTKMLGDSDIAQKGIILISCIFMFVVYIINLFYFKGIPGFMAASFFIALLFAGALTAVSIASGFFKSRLKTYHYELTNCEYREDFESVMKSYRNLVSQYVNKLSENRLAAVKNTLLNCQLKSILEIFIGILTAPFLAYGVSNTLAGCFPEAANWVRISGLRFSPIFLVLATFLIIFAFFSFVRGFTISKQIKGSEIIKLDGFHDYNSHGVTILGIDSMRNLNMEKNVVLFIACFIILIEFTMNVSYFITEIGGDIQGMFLSFVTALVPTALLIAETHLLSSTMYKISNYNDLLAMLD